jgi:hypothetical protein
MVSKPTVFPVWATDDQIDPVSQQNNVLTPPPQKQQYGWARLEFPPRNWFNWLARYTNNWLQWLAQQEAQAIVADGTGTTPTVDIVNGGMSLIYVVDTMATGNFYEGIVYVPPGYSSGTLTYNTVASSTLTVSAISITGAVTVSSGSGPYIVYGQMKNIP